MKGIYIHQGLEFRVEVTGDEFRQSEVVPVTLSVKNHGTSTVPLPALYLHLAVGDARKVKAKAENAFQILSSADCGGDSELAAGESKSVRWEFPLDRNFPITDKKHSPYLIFGSGVSTLYPGQALLTVKPHGDFDKVVETMEMVYQFITRDVTSKDGWVTAKFKAPDTKRFSTVDELNLSCRFANDALELKYVFSVKRFDTSATDTKLKKAKEEIAQKFDVSQYKMGGNLINHDFLESSIGEALGQGAGPI